MPANYKPWNRPNGYFGAGPCDIAAAGFTLGVMQQILRAFGRVASSFQYLVNSWSTIVELLSIYKRLVEMMGGEIWVESQPGSGSAFHFTVCVDLNFENGRAMGSDLLALRNA